MIKTCIECGEAGKVIEVRDTAYGVRRRYECPNGHRWSSAEIQLDDFFTLRKSADFLSQILGEVDTIAATADRCARVRDEI